MRVVGAHTYIALSQASLFPRKVFTFPRAHSQTDTNRIYRRRQKGKYHLTNEMRVMYIFQI